MAKISNWVGPQDSSGSDVYDQLSRFLTFEAAGSIAAGDWVSFNTGGTATEIVGTVIKAAVVATGNPAVIGVATAAASSGQPVVVQVQGYCTFAKATCSAGDPLIAAGTTAGLAEVRAATDLVDSCGIALTADTASVATVYISNPQKL